MKQLYFSVWARLGHQSEPGRCWLGNFSMLRRPRCLGSTSLGEVIRPLMIALESVRSRNASVGTCTALIIPTWPRRNSILRAKTAIVKLSGSYRGDPRRWANGGLSDERVLMWIHGELAANASTPMRNTSLIGLLNARNVLVLSSYLTSAALLVTKSLKHMKQSGKPNKREWELGSQCARISTLLLKIRKSSERLWRNWESMAARLKNDSVTKYEKSRSRGKNNRQPHQWESLWDLDSLSSSCTQATQGCRRYRSSSTRRSSIIDHKISANQKNLYSWCKQKASPVRNQHEELSAEVQKLQPNLK